MPRCCSELQLAGGFPICSTGAMLLEVYRKSTGRDLPRQQTRGFRGISSLRAYYHQKSSGKNLKQVIWSPDT